MLMMGSDLKVPEPPPSGTGPPYVLISFIIALSSLAPQATEREMRAEEFPTAWCRARTKVVIPAPSRCDGCCGRG